MNPSPSLRFLQRLLAMTSLTLALWLAACPLRAQSVSIMNSYGQPCVGDDMVFTLTAGGCSTSWYVGGSNYTVLSQSGSGIRVRWNSPQSSAYVSAYYSGCSSPSGASGNVSSSLYNIAAKVTPSLGGVSASKTTICANESVTFTATTPVNGGSSPSYYWYINGTMVSSGNPSPSFTTTALTTGATQTTSTVTCTMLTNATCITTTSASASVNVTVNPRPVDGTITADLPNICLGQSVTISSNGGVGTPYYWCSTDGGATWNVFSAAYGGQTNFSYVPTQAGTYRFHLRNSTVCGFCWETGNSCPTGPIVDVNVYAYPSASITASGTTSLCPGGSVTLSVPSMAGYGYQWRKDGVNISSGTGSTRLPRPVPTTW